ncbi:YdaU family protein [Burkholderia contaminans]|uniref:YdaU family protein n=1 Tax=Burkholderia contaminans TaxID=488447 RepID=UPI002150460A|nr:YdaU family protein [Burkholderia contaminans]UUX38864.1 YdaU family protein [Burkholderia contaminans]
MNFYKRHIGDYLKDTAHLSLLEHGIYTRLLDVYYTREAGIPEIQAARLIGARSKEEIEALRVVLDEFFELIDGTWLQQRCEREIEEASAQAKANRENGKKGGRPKAKKNPPDNPDGTQEITETKPSGNPSGSVSLTEKNLSQTPDSRLQTPDLPEAQQQALTGVGAGQPASIASPVSRSIEIAVYLRQRGIVGANSVNPNIAAWGDDARVTNEILDAALSIVGSRQLDKPVGPNYLVGIIADLLAPKPAKPAVKADDWHRSEAGIKRKGQELGMQARGGESWDQFKARIWDEISRREREGAAA